MKNDGPPSLQCNQVGNFHLLDFPYFAIVLKDSAVISVGEDIEDTRFMAGMYIALNTGFSETVSELEANVTNAEYIPNLNCPQYQEATSGFFLVPCTDALFEEVMSRKDFLLDYIEYEAGICLHIEAPFFPN